MVEGNDVVDLAKSLKGKVNYVFGADDIANGKGDCSSFTSYIYDSVGIDIGRDTETQWTGKGQKITRNELKTGDLVFFKDTYNSGHTDGVSHVGIYSGNGNFIHLSSSGGVKESSLLDDYWEKHYLGAKTIQGVEGQHTMTGVQQTSATGWIIDKLNIANIITYILVGLIIIVGVVLIAISLRRN